MDKQLLGSESEAVEQNNSTNISGWGGLSKVKALVDGKLVDQQNATNPLNTSVNWIGDTTNLGNRTSPMGTIFNCILASAPILQ